MPSSATEPIAAARSTLGSGRASSTNPATPSTPTTSRPRARTPAQRATTSRKPTTSVRLVPETAARWVSPQVRKSSTTSSDICWSSPTTRAGTSARESGGAPATAARIPARTRAAPRTAPRWLDTVGERPVDRTAARSGPSGRPADPSPGPSRRAARAPVLVADDEHGRPGARSRLRRRRRPPSTRVSVNEPNLPRRSTGSESPARSRRTAARSCASERPRRCGWRRRAARSRPPPRGRDQAGGQGRDRASPPRRATAPTRRAEQHGTGPAGQAEGGEPAGPGRGTEHHRAQRSGRACPGRRLAVAAAWRAAAASARAGTSEGEERRHLGERRVADAGDLEQLVDGGERRRSRCGRRGSSARSPVRRRAAPRARPGRRC